MSEFEAITYGALVAATPRLMLAPKPSVRSLTITFASRLEGEPPGLTTKTSSSTCGASELRHGPGAGAPGGQIPIAAVFTRAAPGRPRACGGRSRPTSSRPHGRALPRAGAR